MSNAFSKIWIVVIAVVLVVGGIFAWQYLQAPKEEQKEITIDQILIEIMEGLEKETTRKAEKEGWELKLTEEERKKLKEEIRQRFGEELEVMTREEFEKFKKEMEGIIPTMAEVLIQKEKTRIAARNTVRKANMREIVWAQEMYHAKHGQFYQSVNYPLSIPPLMPEMPTDPLTKEPYGWIDNARNPQKFCVYATLERGGWSTASHKGNPECSDLKPVLEDCCFE